MTTIRTAGAVLLGATALWSGCGGTEDAPSKAPEATKPPKAPAEEASRRPVPARKARKAVKPRPAKTTPEPESPRKPTAAMIKAGRERQGDNQVTRRSPREERLFKIGSERPVNPQEPRKLSPREERLFKLGSESEKYQKSP